MSDANRPDRARAAALERIERAEWTYKLGIVAVAACEAGFGAAYLILMDFRDRLHWLILIAAVLTYSVVLIGVINLGVYVNASTQTILKAIFAKGQDDSGALPP